MQEVYVHHAATTIRERNTRIRCKVEMSNLHALPRPTLLRFPSGCNIARTVFHTKGNTHPDDEIASRVQRALPCVRKRQHRVCRPILARNPTPEQVSTVFEVP